MFFPDDFRNTPENNEEGSAPQENNVNEEPRQTYEPETTSEMWSEPKYEAPNTDYNDIYSPSANLHSEPKEKEKKPKKNRGLLKALCLVLVCALVSSGCCYGIVSYMLENRDTSPVINRNEVVIGSSEPGVSSDSVVPVVSSEVPSQIYAKATDFQVVGIQTNVTTNIFGQTTSSAVSGTGFVISDEGYILTNYHVISYSAQYGYEMTVMFADGTSLPAEIVGYLEDNDVAVIKIDPTGLDLNPVSLGNSDNLIVGEVVYAIGNPLGELTYTMTEGIVSATDRVITTTDSATNTSTSINMFQISAAVNSGNSGGPVYDSNGQVIGVVTAKYSDSGVEGLGFAIPINDAISIASQIIEKGYVSSATLGITCSPTSSVYSDFAVQYYGLPSGVVVLSINEGSAAEKSGLAVGDIITALNGTEVSSTDELKYLLRQYEPGDTGTLTVYRFNSDNGSGSSLDLSITYDDSSDLETEQQSVDSSDGQPSQEQPQQSIPDSWSGIFPFFGG